MKKMKAVLKCICGIMNGEKRGKKVDVAHVLLNIQNDMEKKIDLFLHSQVPHIWLFFFFGFGDFFLVLLLLFFSSLLVMS